MLHQFLSHHRGLADVLAAMLAGATTVSFLQGLTPYVTLAVGLGSLSLIALRWHDRIRYGHKVKD